MSVGVVLMIVMLLALIVAVFGPMAYEMVNTKDKKLAKQAQSFINKSNSKIECTVDERTLTYTYDIHSCYHKKITLERRYVDGHYDKSHQFCGTIEEAIENRLKDLNRQNLEEEPLVTRS